MELASRLFAHRFGFSEGLVAMNDGSLQFIEILKQILCGPLADRKRVTVQAAGGGASGDGGRSEIV